MTRMPLAQSLCWTTQAGFENDQTNIHDVLQPGLKQNKKLLGFGLIVEQRTQEELGSKHELSVCQTT